MAIIDNELEFAVAENNINLAKKLILQGANVNSTLSIGCYPPLVIAAKFGFYDMAKFLIDNGADIHLLFNPGIGPVHSQTVIAIASLYNRLDIIKLFVERGCNINFSNSEGMTAIIIAASKGYIDQLMYLLINGASVNHKNKYGETALFAACVKNNNDCIKLLLQNGADTTVRDIDGDTCESVLRNNGNTQMLSLVRNSSRITSNPTSTGTCLVVLLLFTIPAVVAVHKLII